MTKNNSDEENQAKKQTNSIFEQNTQIQTGLDNILGDKEAALMMAAPYKPAQVSPGRSISPNIGKSEEKYIEKAIKSVEADNLKLNINSPGGSVSSSYKIAKSLVEIFEDIEVYVPHYAKSGGTLISLAGDEIVMGMMSELGPLDPQYTDSSGETHSATTYIEAYDNTIERLSRIHPQDASMASQAEYSELDPVKRKEMGNAKEMMEKYGKDILSQHEFSDEEVEDAINYFLEDSPSHTHSYCVMYDEAAEKLPNSMVLREEERQEEMDVMSSWFGAYSSRGNNDHWIKIYE